MGPWEISSDHFRAPSPPAGRIRMEQAIMEVVMFRFNSFIGVACFLATSFGQAFAQDDRWFFTASEMDSSYRYQQQFGARLRNPLEPQICFQGKMNFFASYQDRGFVAPCQFVRETIRQLRDLLESRTARYLFPLDVDSADLALPADVYASKYKELPREEMLPALLREPTLVAIYHTAVHLDTAVGDQGSVTSVWGNKRTVAGFYDGRPNRVLSPRSGEEDDSELKGLVGLGSFNMMGHFLGELTFVANGTVMTFDLSFDNDRGATPTKEVATVSTAVR